LLTVWAGAVHAETPEVSAGRRVAQRNCAECHALDKGPSPLADAPPFAELHRRYPRGGLGQLLSEGMLAPIDTQEEGHVRVHPRMPQAQLGEDEVFELVEYLRSLEPRRSRRR
jgi:mono/diheme cytochrome c family protein